MVRSGCLLLLIAASCASSQDAAPEKVESPRWPRSYEDSGDKLVVYEPQVDDGWKEHQSLHARSAIVVTPKGGKEVYGVVEYDVETEVAVDAAEVLLKNRQIQATRFPGTPEDVSEKAGAIVRRILNPRRSVIVP